MDYALPTTHEAIALSVVSTFQKSENARPFFPLSCHIPRRSAITPGAGKRRRGALSVYAGDNTPLLIAYTPLPVDCGRPNTTCAFPHDPPVDYTTGLCSRANARKTPRHRKTHWANARDQHPFCTSYVAIYCCSGCLSSSLARSLHLPLRHADLVGVAALLTFGREDTAAVPCRKGPRTREEKDEGVPRVHRVWCPPL